MNLNNRFTKFVDLIGAIKLLKADDGHPMIFANLAHLVVGIQGQFTVFLVGILVVALIIVFFREIATRLHLGWIGLGNHPSSEKDATRQEKTADDRHFHG